MGSQRDGNGSDRPPEGGPPDGLPGLPPEWGTVIIPDDISELDEEAERIRRDLRRQERRRRWHERLGVPAPYGGPIEETPRLGIPLLIMAVAIVAAVTSLFTITLSGRLDKSTGQAAAKASTASSSAPDATLADASGAPVRLRDMLPAVVLLVDGCDCTDLVNQTAADAPPGVRVLAVAHTAPSLQVAADSRVRRLADPAGSLAAAYQSQSAPPNSATAVLIRGGGQIVLISSGVTSVDAIRGEFAKLTS